MLCQGTVQGVGIFLYFSALDFFLFVSPLTVLHFALWGRYRENLMKFYILHASYTFRMYFWMILPLETTT